MNLDFSELSPPVLSLSSRKAWGHAGTAGTQGFMRVSASPGGGDGAGTHGDGDAIGAGSGVAEEGAQCAGPAAGPQLSPACPRQVACGTPNEINVSPSSPLVPGRDGRNALDTDIDREAFEERAAIMEFDGGMSRAEAEAAAWALMTKSK